MSDKTFSEKISEATHDASRAVQEKAHDANRAAQEKAHDANRAAQGKPTADQPLQPAPK